jgi:hypothetical protein
MNNNKEGIWIQKQLDDIEDKKKELDNDKRKVERLSKLFIKGKSRRMPKKFKFNISERYNYIYLIYLSTIGMKGQRIYKFGKTYNVMSRFHQYPKDSTVIFLCRVKDCHYVEDEIYKSFLKYFDQHREYGREYFAAHHVEEMINCMDRLIDHMHQKVNDNNMKKIVRSYENIIKFRINEKATDDLDNELIQYYATNKSLDISKNKYTSEKTMKIEDDIDTNNDKKKLFRCEKCNKKFTRKENYVLHTNKKICDGRIYKCKYCYNGYTKPCNLYRHMKNCDNNNLVSNTDIATKKNNTILKTINNTFALVECGREDFSKIDKNEVLKVLRTGCFSTVNLTELINFNPKYPEYHNVYIPNMKDKYAMKYNGYTWEMVIKSELVDAIYNTKKVFIKENLDKFVNLLTNSQKEELAVWLKNDDDDKKIKLVKEKIKLLLYNKKDLVIETKKNM